MATLPHQLRARLLGLPPLAPVAGSAAAGWVPVSALYLLSAAYLAAGAALPASSFASAQVELLPLALVAFALVALALGRLFLLLVGYRTEAPVYPILATALFAPFGLGQVAALFGALAVLQNAKQRGLFAPLAALLFWNLAVWPWLLYANTLVYYRLVVDEGVTVLVDPALSTFVVLGAFILAATTTLSLLGGWWRCRSRAAQARALTRAQPALTPGDAIVTGTVALAPGESHAVRLDIEQAGEEYYDSGEWVRWTEVERRLSVRPFYLQLEGGHWLRVEPSSNVRLMDDLHGAVLVDRRHRTRSAELTVGERITAVGRLSFEGDAHGNPNWVLREPPGAPLLLASLPLEAPFARHQRALGWTLGVCAVLFALVLSVLVIAYADGGLAAGPLAFLDPALPWLLMIAPAGIACLSLLGQLIAATPGWYEETTVDDRESGRLAPGPEPAITKKKARPTVAAQEQGGRLLGLVGLLAVVLTACLVPAGIGVHYVFSRLGRATVVGLDTDSLVREQERRVRSDFPVYTRLPPAIEKRMGRVVRECGARAPNRLLVVLVFDDGGELHDALLYGDFQVRPGGANPGESDREACVRQVSTGLRIAWSPTQRYRLYVAEMKL